MFQGVPIFQQNKFWGSKFFEKIGPGSAYLGGSKSVVTGLQKFRDL